MPGYSTLRVKKNQLIRKARDGSAFVANFTAPAITTLTTGAAADLTALPAGYEDLGWATTDGATYARATNQTDISAFGSLDPVRSDITSDAITMQVTAQETKMLTIGLVTGADTTNLKAAAITGELSIPKPDRPSMRYYRILGLFVDTDDNGSEIYLARFMPRARVTAIGDTVYNSADNAVQAQLTFTGYQDATLGYSHRWIYGGPGWLALLAAMGITQSP